MNETGLAPGAEPDGSSRFLTPRIRALLPRLARIFLILAFLVPTVDRIVYYLDDPSKLWGDGHIYFAATQAWIQGGNPWQTTFDGVPFAGPPTALLLNLPLLPFGETWAIGFWVVVDVLAVVILLRRLHLGIWWLAYFPIFEGVAAASPDVALAGLAVVGVGALAALTKPYSIPALLADRKFLGLAIAAVALAGTFPFLPWALFLQQGSAIATVYQENAAPLGALGDPLLVVGVVIGLVLVGGRMALGLLTPALLALQAHYVLFSLRWIAASWIMSVATAVVRPDHVYAYGFLAFALWTRRDLVFALLATRGRQRAA